MMTKTRWIWVLTLAWGLGPAMVAFSQQPENAEETDAEVVRDGDEYHAGSVDPVRGPDIRDRKNRRAYNMDRVLSYMKRDLDLDPDQLETIEELFEERREEYDRELEEQRERSLGNRDLMRDLLLQMRDARDGNDREAMQKITERIRSMQEASRVQEISDDFAARVEEVLNEEQVEPFRTMIKIGTVDREDPSAAVRKNPGMLRRYVLRLDIDDEQRAAMDDLYRDLQLDLREGQFGPAERNKTANEFYDDVMQLLDDDQIAMLEKHLGADQKRSGGRASPSGDGDRADRAPDDRDDDATVEEDESIDGDREDDDEMN